MPDPYIRNAEARVQAAGEALLAKNNHPKITYRTDVDPVFIQEQIKNYGFVKMVAGDEVHVFDTDMTIDNDFRISELTRSLYDDGYSLILSETALITRAAELGLRVDNIEKAIEATNQKEVETKRKNVETVGALKNKVFNPVDDHFQPENDRSESINPRMLSYDSGAPQFSLKNVLVEVNYGGDEDAIKVGAGQIVLHNYKGKTLKRWDIKKLKDEGQEYNPTRTWQVTETYFNLTSKQGYWLYAKLNMFPGSTECILEVSQEHKEIKLEIDGGYIKYKLGHISDASSPRTAAMLSGNVKSYSSTEYHVVYQPGHRFSEKQAIRDTGIEWVLAQANNDENAQTMGVVTKIIDADHFRYQSGDFYNHPDFVRGVEYFLSPTVAGLIAPEPDNYNVGEVRQSLGFGTDRGLKIEIDVGDVVGLLLNKKLVGAWDREFEFCINKGVSEEFIVDLWACYDYNVAAIILMADNGTVDVSLYKNDTAIAGMENITVTDTRTLIEIPSSATIEESDMLKLVTSVNYSGDPGFIHGKLKTLRE